MLLPARKPTPFCVVTNKMPKDNRPVWGSTFPAVVELPKMWGPLGLFFAVLLFVVVVEPPPTCLVFVAVAQTLVTGTVTGVPPQDWLRDAGRGGWMASRLRVLTLELWILGAGSVHGPMNIDMYVYTYTYIYIYNYIYICLNNNRHITHTYIYIYITVYQIPCPAFGPFRGWSISHEQYIAKMIQGFM